MYSIESFVHLRRKNLLHLIQMPQILRRKYTNNAIENIPRSFLKHREKSRFHKRGEFFSFFKENVVCFTVFVRKP